MGRGSKSKTPAEMKNLSNSAGEDPQKRVEPMKADTPPAGGGSEQQTMERKWGRMGLCCSLFDVGGPKPLACALHCSVGGRWKVVDHFETPTGCGHHMPGIDYVHCSRAVALSTLVATSFKVHSCSEHNTHTPPITIDFDALDSKPSYRSRPSPRPSVKQSPATIVCGR